MYIINFSFCFSLLVTKSPDPGSFPFQKIVIYHLGTPSIVKPGYAYAMFSQSGKPTGIVITIAH